MARGRPKKRSNRIYAAIDAMRQLGYEQGRVVSVVNKLVEVYGVEGWHFIEECAYMVLIEALIEEEDQEKAANGENQLMDQRFDGNNDGAAETSTRVAVVNDTVPQDVEKPSDVTEEPTCSEVLSSSSGVQETGTGNAAWKDILPPSGNVQTEAAAKTACEATKHVNTEAEPLDLIPVAPPTNARPAPRHRQPCYGWIESNDESAIAFVYLKAAAAVHGFKRPDMMQLPSEPPTGVGRKRKSRWDQMPTDP